MSVDVGVVAGVVVGDVSDSLHVLFMLTDRLKIVGVNPFKHAQL